MESFTEFLAASGYHDPARNDRRHVYRRMVMNLSQSYDEIYPNISKGCLLQESAVPEKWRVIWQMGNAEVF